MARSNSIIGFSFVMAHRLTACCFPPRKIVTTRSNLCSSISFGAGRAQTLILSISQIGCAETRSWAPPFFSLAASVCPMRQHHHHFCPEIAPKTAERPGVAQAHQRGRAQGKSETTRNEPDGEERAPRVHSYLPAHPSNPIKPTCVVHDDCP